MLFSSSAGVINKKKKGAFLFFDRCKGKWMIGNSIRCLNCKSDVVVPGLFPVPLFVCCLRFASRPYVHRTALLVSYQSTFPGMYSYGH